VDENIFVIIKHHKGELTINQLAEIAEDWATHDDVAKAVWKWLQHTKQE
jgi:hypothetical protein